MIAKLFQSGEGQHLDVLGDNQFVKLRGEDTGGRFTLIEQINLTGSGVPMHLHEREDEVFHIIEGAVTFETEGKIFTAEQGATVFLPRQIPHAWRVEHGGVTKVMLICTPAGMEKMFEEIDALKSRDMSQITKICAGYGIHFV